MRIRKEVSIQAGVTAANITAKPQVGHNQAQIIQMFMDEHGMTALQANRALAEVMKELKLRGANRKPTKAEKRRGK